MQHEQGATDRVNPISALVDEWQDIRKALHEAEEAAHPPITDVLGRVWTWKDGDLYTHDSMAWPREFVESANIGLPSKTRTTGGARSARRAMRR